MLLNKQPTHKHNNKHKLNFPHKNMNKKIIYYIMTTIEVALFKPVIHKGDRFNKKL